MKIGLIDIDSVIPNLALMKLSAYHKSKGDQVEWWKGILFNKQYDKVYASKVFDFSKLPYDLPKNVEIGGSGYDLKKKLPSEIECEKPDYLIYPDCNYSIGFVTRGCIRDCEFCIVPKKEGKVEQVNLIERIWRGKGNLILLDNNILTRFDLFKKVLEFCKDKNIKVDFNQGLDCRLINEEKAEFINQYRKYILEIRFAFDNLDYRDAVEKTSKLVKGGNFWYVYCDENIESALERLLILKRLKQRTYLMRNNRITGKGFHKYTVLSKWASCNQFIQGMDIFHFIENYKSLNLGKEGRYIDNNMKELVPTP